jgi:hypothetical protein
MERHSRALSLGSSKVFLTVDQSERNESILKFEKKIKLKMLSSAKSPASTTLPANEVVTIDQFYKATIASLAHYLDNNNTPLSSAEIGLLGEYTDVWRVNVDGPPPQQFTIPISSVISSNMRIAIVESVDRTRREKVEAAKKEREKLEKEEKEVGMIVKKSKEEVE